MWTSPLIITLAMHCPMQLCKMTWAHYMPMKCTHIKNVFTQDKQNTDSGTQYSVLSLSLSLSHAHTTQHTSIYAHTFVYLSACNATSHSLHISMATIYQIYMIIYQCSNNIINTMHLIILR